jgi:hypothetical protein
VEDGVRVFHQVGEWVGGLVGALLER